MQKYQNNAQDALGNAIPAASVTVRLFPSNVLATLFQDAAGTIPLSNPTTTDSLGLFSFYAANGNYTVIVTKSGFATQTFNGVQLFDPNGGGSAGTFTTITSTDPTQSTSSTTGAVQIAGGMGIVKDVWIGGSVNGIIGGTTPAAGSFTVLSTSGAYTPSQTAGIVGTTTNNNANAGSVGEFITATGSAVSFTSSVSANVTSISLTAGDWDVEGNVEYDPSGGASITQAATSIGITSATLQLIPSRAIGNFTSGAGYQQSQIPPKTRISIASTTTIFLVGFAVFSGGTLTAGGFIRARRIR